MVTNPRNIRPAASGGTVFAATVLAIVGVFNIIWGLVAIGTTSYYRVNDLAFGDIEGWGAAAFVIGILQIVAAVLIAQGEVVGQFLGIMMAAFGGIAALLSVGAYPIWSITIMVLCGVIIWSLAKDDAYFTA